MAESDNAPEGKTGPKPGRVKIEMDWEKAVGKAMEKERPKEGWPELEKKRKGSSQKGVARMKDSSNGRAEIEAALAELWAQTRSVVTKVLQNCEIHGFELMHNANPSMEEVVRLMDNVALPLLDHILSSDFMNPYEEMKLVNIHQFAWHLRQISKAIQDGNSELFNEQYRMLNKASESL